MDNIKDLKNKFKGEIPIQNNQEVTVPNKNCPKCFGRGTLGKDEKGNNILCPKCKRLLLKG